MNQLPLRERNKQRIRERILETAIALFKGVGYHHTTMDEIAEQAEISRGTLFNYFPTKDSLLIPFVEDLLKTRIRPAVMAYLNEQPSTLETLRFFFMTIHEQVLTIPYIDQAFKQEFLRSRDLSAEELNQHNEFLDIVVAILLHGRQRGEVRSDGSLETLARYIGILYVSIFYSMVMELQPKPLDYEAEMNDLLRFVEHGIAHTDNTSTA